MKFKVGDRVRAIGKVDGVNLTGKCGEVIYIREANCGIFDLGVEFDEPCAGGHDCNKKGKDGYCRYGFEKEFELIKYDQKIVITSNGKETLARLYKGNKVVKTAIAKCSPEDTFNFATGAKIAYDRLMGEENVTEEPKYYNGRVVCTDVPPSYAYTKGKIYEVVDGELTNNNGFKTPKVKAKSFEELCGALGHFAKFIEIKE